MNSTHPALWALPAVYPGLTSSHCWWWGECQWCREGLAQHHQIGKDGYSTSSAASGCSADASCPFCQLNSGYQYPSSGSWCTCGLKDSFEQFPGFYLSEWIPAQSQFLLLDVEVGFVYRTVSYIIMKLGKNIWLIRTISKLTPKYERESLSLSDNDLPFTGLFYTFILVVQSGIKISLIWQKLLHCPGYLSHIPAGYVTPQGFILISDKTFWCIKGGSLGGICSFK